MNNKFTQKLAASLNSNFETEQSCKNLNYVLTNFLNAKHSPNPASGLMPNLTQSTEWDTNEVVDFYSTYAYGSQFEEITRRIDVGTNIPIWKHLKTAIHSHTNLAISKDAKIILMFNQQLDYKFNKRDSYTTKVKLCIYDKAIMFDSTCNIQDIHKAAMIYCYAHQKLQKMTTKEAQNSKYYNIKLTMEDYLKKLSQNQSVDLDLNSILTKDEMEECVSIAKTEALKQELILSDIIPKENGIRKYPTHYDNFVKVALKIESKYSKTKAKKQEKENKKQTKKNIKEVDLSK